MSLFAYTPREVLVHIRESSSVPLARTWRESVRIGVVGFGVASLLVFGSWALAGSWMYRTLGELGAYLVWAAMAMLAGGLGLQSLVLGPRSPGRFLFLFSSAFLSYAVGWMVAWFALRNRAGEWAGSLAGTVVMALVFLGAFSEWRNAVRVATGLFVTHSAGYFTGAWLFDVVGGPAGMLLWGVAYGGLFGAGIGDALFHCQETTRQLLSGPRDSEGSDVPPSPDGEAGGSRFPKF